MGVFVATRALTVTANVPDFEESAELVAVTVTLVCVETTGDVKTPVDETAPALADHVTDCDGEFEPATTAEHVEVEPDETDVGVQVAVTPETVAGPEVMLIDADADLAGSATEVATIVAVAGLGAVTGAV
jgi:hypothetical protein